MLVSAAMGSIVAPRHGPLVYTKFAAGGVPIRRVDGRTIDRDTSRSRWLHSLTAPFSLEPVITTAVPVDMLWFPEIGARGIDIQRKVVHKYSQVLD